jgi:hypothetical protein
MSRHPHPNAPWWTLHLPDSRGWATLGIFAMAADVLHMIAQHPELADNQLFTTCATLLFGSGGFGLVCSFIFGGSKSTVDVAGRALDREDAKAGVAP